jgi:predicted double-glycine peptidase
MKFWFGAKVLLICTVLSSCASTQPEHQSYQYGDTTTWQAVRWGGIVRQELDFSCGLASVGTILQYHYGDETVTERELLSEFVAMLSEAELSKVLANGASMAQLADLLTRRGYVVRSWRVDLPRLQQLVTSLPAIVYLERPDFRHFAVVRGVSDYQVALADSARGNLRLPLSAFQAEWKGSRALFVAKDEAQLANALLATPEVKDVQARAVLVRSIVTSVPQ